MKQGLARDGSLAKTAGRFVEAKREVFKRAAGAKSAGPFFLKGTACLRHTC